MRRWRIVAVAIAIVFVLVFAFVHLPFVRTRVLSWAAAELAHRGIRFEAARLHYNLFTLTVGLDRVTMAAAGSEVPFFEADVVRLDLPVSAIFGAFGVESIEVDRPRVRLVRSADGSWNLPRSTSQDDAGPWLQRAATNRPSCSSPASPFSTATPAGSSWKARGSRSLCSVAPDVRFPAACRWPNRRGFARGAAPREITTLDGSVSFDGETVSIGALDVAAPEGRARFAGTLGPLSGEPG